MRACRFIVRNRFMHGMLHVSSMLSEGILCYGLEAFQATMLKYYACAYTHVVAIPLHKNAEHQLTPHPLLTTINYLKTTILHTTQFN